MVRFRSTLMRLTWTVIFAVPGTILLRAGFQADARHSPMVWASLGGVVLLALAAYGLVATLLAILEVAFPEVKAAVDRPVGAPPPAPAKQAKMFVPFGLALGSLVSYSLALRLYLDPTTVRPAPSGSAFAVMLQPIYDYFGSSGLLIYFLALGSLFMLALLSRWRRTQDQ